MNHMTDTIIKMKMFVWLPVWICLSIFYLNLSINIINVYVWHYKVYRHRDESNGDKVKHLPLSVAER